MRRMFFLLSLAGACLSPAAAADLRQLGEAWMSPKSEMFVQRLAVRAPMERLQLRAEGGDVHCLSVRASFRDGETRVIFHGAVAQDRPVLLPFEGGDTSIRQLRLRCSGPEETRLVISADVGRFSGEWSGDSTLEWALGTARDWGSSLVNGWKLVGTERFGSRYDENRLAVPESEIAALALRPVGRDARCRAGTLLLPNGKSRRLDLDRNDFLAHDRFHRLELPAEAASLDAIALECRATNGARVAIEVFAAS